MRPMNKPVLAAFALGALAGIAAGCQVYDFAPVVPLTFQQSQEETVSFGRAVKPNLMLLVDKSGSMDLPADESDPQCMFTDGGICGRSKGALCDTSVCPTRWSELQGAMNDFLTTQGTVARMGLATYPTNLTCGVDTSSPSKVVVALNQSDDDAASLEATASEINAAIQAISSSGSTIDTATGGGTPTGNSVSDLVALPELQSDQREDFLLVLTDGLPNCNPNHPTPAPDPNCRCTGICRTTDATRSLGCLDKDATVQAITDARASAVRTIIVGFGAELAAGAGPEVLNAMATAGGFPFACGAGAGTCPAGETCQADGTCSTTKFYSASNRTDLARALGEIGNLLDNAEPCVFPLKQDPENFDERLVIVYITEPGQPERRTTAGPDTFTYEPGVVTLVGETCNLVLNATNAAPIGVRIAVISTL